LSEKRPETDADIITRSRVLMGSGVGLAPSRRGKAYSVDLPSHMAECDANYHRLLRLFPSLREAQELAFALFLPSFDARVAFTVLEESPYTTLLGIKVSVDNEWLALAAAPEMSVRVYHDAQSAEIVSYQKQNRFHGKYEYPNARMRQRDEKVQLNRFLGEFLTLCLEHGASAEPISF
jgi:uncharacterized protein YqiB (DUF1249 family)